MVGGNAKRFRTPLTKDDVSGLKVGDLVLLDGSILTGRDRIHKMLCNEKPSPSDIPFRLEGGVIYHCGPIIKKTDEGYRLIAAGPTTSMRVDMYTPDVIKLYGIRGVIGKGGMGPDTLASLKEYGCVYLQTVSGAAAYLADRIKTVNSGWMIGEFGEPEAMWELDVEGFPAVVTMDAHGNSLHRNIEETSLKNLLHLI